MRSVIERYCPAGEPILIDTNVVRGMSDVLRRLKPLIKHSGNRRAISSLFDETYQHYSEIEEILASHTSIVPVEVRKELAHFDSKLHELQGGAAYGTQLNSYFDNINFLRNELQCRDPRESQFMYPALSLFNGSSAPLEVVFPMVQDAFQSLPLKKRMRRNDEADVALVALAYTLSAKNDFTPSIVSADQDIVQLFNATWPYMHSAYRKGTSGKVVTFTSPTRKTSVQIVNPYRPWSLPVSR